MKKNKKQVEEVVAESPVVELQVTLEEAAAIEDLVAKNASNDNAPVPSALIMKPRSIGLTSPVQSWIQGGVRGRPSRDD